MDRYLALAAELADPRYEGLTDVQIVESINSPGPGRYVMVSPSSLLRWSAATGTRVAIEANVTHASPVIASICLAVRDQLRSGAIGLDYAAPAIRQMTAALVSAGVLTQAQSDSLAALATTPGPSRAESVFGASVTIHDLVRAREAK